MFGKSNKPAVPPGRVSFDFEFSEDERKRKGFTKSELVNILKYDGIDTCEVTTRNFTKTTVTAKVTDPGDSKTKEVKLLSKLSGTIAEAQLDTLMSLFGKS